MAINIITINGTDSIAASRVTLNNNFTEVKTKVDPILDSFDTSNGVLNISTLTNGQLIAKRLTITTAGINVQGGAVTLGASSNMTLNGGTLTLTTGAADFSGGATAKGLTLSTASKLNEAGDFNFTAATVNDTTAKRTLYVTSANTNSEITLDVLTTTTEIFVINDKPSAIDLIFGSGSGLFGNDVDTSKINIPATGTAVIKFVIPDGVTDGKWWLFGGDKSTIVTV